MDACAPVSYWTLHRHSSGAFMAKRWIDQGEYRWDGGDIFRSLTLEPLREEMRKLGLTCYAPGIKDPPKTLEAWS